MPTINVNKKRFFKLIGKKYKDEEIAYHLAMLGTDVEEITDKEIIVEIFPNRPDMLSEEGLARAMRYFLGIENKIEEVKTTYRGKEVVLTEDAIKIRPAVRVAIVRGIKIDEEGLNSLIQLQEKLHITHGRKRKKVSIGVHDISNISFPLKYKKVESSYSFIPLGFNKPTTIKEILKHHPKGQEYGHLTKENEYVVWEDNKGEVLAFPPIINGNITAVTLRTKDVLIDVTGTHEKEVEQALNIMVYHLIELGGKVEKIKMKYAEKEVFSPNLSYKNIKINKKYIEELIGIKIEDYNSLLRKMGMYIEKDKVYYPPYRTDILHPMDVVEDIAIAYGYNRIKEEKHSETTIAQEDNKAQVNKIIRQILNGFGALEVKNYHLTNKEIVFNMLGIKEERTIVTKNPMNIEYNILRPALFPLLMKVLSENKRYEYPQFIYEIGTIFKLKNNKSDEMSSLCVAYAANDANFSRIKSILTGLARELNITLNFTPVQQEYLIPGRGASVIFKNKSIGWIGEIHPGVINKFGLEIPIVALEISLEEVYNTIKSKK